MNPARFIVVLALSLLLFGAGSSWAATANFQGNCPVSGGTASCQFDAQRGGGSSCPGSFIWKYSWDFGDGSTALTGSSLISHSYPAPGAGSYTVTLTVLCWDGNAPTKVRNVCLSFSVPGCINANGGWL